MKIIEFFSGIGGMHFALKGMYSINNNFFINDTGQIIVSGIVDITM